MIYITEKEISLLDFISKIYNGISKQKAKNIIKYSTILIDGKKVKAIPSTCLQKEQKIEIIQSKKNQNEKISKSAHFEIKFEDEYLIIAVKPPGILASKEKFQNENSFFKIVERFLTERDKKKMQLFVVHRLDREVEGLIIFAKSEKIQQLLKNNWQNVKKKYIAISEHKPENDYGILEDWLKDNYNQKVTLHNKEIEDSKYAKTEYKYIKQIGNFHLLEIQLHTGRKNQIRVHLSSIGCPIVGDRKYGASDEFERQIRLAAVYLEFMHPFSQKKILVEYNPKRNFFNPKNENEKYKLKY